MPVAQPVHIIVTSSETVELAALTIRSLAANSLGRRLVVGLDVDAAFSDADQFMTFDELARLTGRDATEAAWSLTRPQLVSHAGALAARHVFEIRQAPVVTIVAPGVLVLGDLARWLPDEAHEMTVATRAGLDNDDSAGPGRFSAVLYSIRSPAVARALELTTGDWSRAAAAVDLVATHATTRILRDQGALVSADRTSAGVSFAVPDGTAGLTVDGDPVLALDLTAVDRSRPWLLDAHRPTLPALRLSDHPHLRSTIDRWLSETTVPTTVSPSRTPPPAIDDVLRAEFRAQVSAGQPLPSLDDRDEVLRWATELLPVGHGQPVARYLAGIRAARRDLCQAFPVVPGRDSEGLARWALEHGAGEGFDAELIQAAAAMTLAHEPPPPPAPPRKRGDGVNLVGFLSGEFGLGVSVRLMDEALQAGGIPTSTFDVSDDLFHRRNAVFRNTDATAHNTTLVCVNGPETREVLNKVHEIAHGTHKIGMWYWEFEEFPASQHVGVDLVDEVWVATDFIRDAVKAAAPNLPVRTVMPPLPQRSGAAAPGELPTRFKISAGQPYFLFTFDYLSSADRKNPLGLLEAFTRSWPHPTQDGPLLVIKTINADLAPSDSERLRVEVSSHPHVRIIDEYLPDDERDVLVAHCAAYVSLHKAEGLGLTIAEAMAWGKPVIITAYGGPLQFANTENAMLVPWAPGVVKDASGPYVAGMRWAEPDLDEAARLMRLVLKEPEHARALGERAARDIRDLHSFEAASARIKEVLEEGFAARKAARQAARAARQRARQEAEAGEAKADSATLRSRLGRLRGTRP